jgi:hypothetical protein
MKIPPLLESPNQILSEPQFKTKKRNSLSNQLLNIIFIFSYFLAL